jgi:predicted nucleic acid-binding protein
MVDFAVDTDIVIDILKNYSPAMQWLHSQRATKLGVSHIMRMEIILGSQNKFEQRQAIKVLQQFDVIEMNQADLDWAYDQLTKVHLSHGIGIMDCLIAAPCHRLALPLYTRNLKHFTPILGTVVQAPY